MPAIALADNEGEGEGVRRDEAVLRLKPAHPTGPTKSARGVG